MTCPKCGSDNTSPVGTSHYVCNNPGCVNNGTKTQFKFIVDNKIRFPHNQIFINRSNQEFFRKPYLELISVGQTNI